MDNLIFNIGLLTFVVGVLLLVALTAYSVVSDTPRSRQVLGVVHSVLFVSFALVLFGGGSVAFALVRRLMS